MSYIQLYELLPDVAERETRTITAFEQNDFGIPPDEYVLVEMYCNDVDRLKRHYKLFRAKIDEHYKNKQV